MTAVADTSPLNYLVLIGLPELLPALFDHVLIPEAVRQELMSVATPAPVRTWVANAPSWLAVRIVSAIPTDLQQLGPGELEAIALAETTGSRMILLDERKARQVARHRGLLVSGTLGILDQAAQQGLIDLTDALDRLTHTSFRVSPRLLQSLRARQSHDTP